MFGGLTMPKATLSSLLAGSRPVLFDGAVGTELSRRGVRTTLPLWSANALLDAEALQTLAQVHLDYARAGAQILVTNTFRTTVRALQAAGHADNWRLLNRRAVEAARAAADATDSHPCLVAGGIAPLEDCYRPDRVPPQADCLAEHRRQVELFAELGVDFIFIETMNSGREALAALAAARDCGLDVLLSLCPKPPNHLLSGEPLEEVVADLVAAGGSTLRGLLLNCATPEVMEEVYPRFVPLADGLPHGLYAHLGQPEETIGWKFLPHDEPQHYADWMARCLEQGARLIGGCCGTTPAHIAALARLLQQGRSAR